MTDMSEVPRADADVCARVSDYVLNVRSYAPFARFGGGFEGDNRGPSTSKTATSRLAVEIMFNTQSGQVGKPMATSSGTQWLPLGIRGMAEPRVTLVSTSRVPKGVSITVDLAGSNPLVPGAPDIDLHATLWFTLESGFLQVLAALSGDRFPNAEMFVTDGRGEARMLLTYETTSGPLAGPTFSLPGNGKLEMNSLCVGFPVDAGGLFR